MYNMHLHIIGSNFFYRFIKELDLNYVLFSDDNIEYNDHNSVIRIVFAEKMQLAKLKSILFNNIPTVFLLNSKDFLIKNKLNLLNFHISLTLPIEIISFREILNILHTKYNFFKNSKIIIRGYEIDSNQRIIMKNGQKVKLTEKELDLILALNKRNGLDKYFLLKNIWNYNLDLETHAFETHLHRLRKKIYKFFKDKKFIVEKNSLYYLSN